MTYKKNSVKKPVAFVTTDELKTRIDNKANDEKRSRSNMIEYMCKFYLEITENKKRL